jgi:hypothetical protein
LSHDKFLPRFLLHLLPEGFVRIRHFGLLASRRRATTLPLCFQLLGVTQEPPVEEHARSTEDAPDLYRCPKCGGPMEVIANGSPLRNSNFVPFLLANALSVPGRGLRPTA